MSATALLLQEAGWQVTGSDAEFYGPPRALLERNGISFTVGYQPENIPSDVDCFIIGRSAKLLPSENAEVRAALATGKPHYSFPEMLGKLTEKRHNCVVAGSYGKSTTTSILAHILRHSGVDAGYFVGAEPVATSWLTAPTANGTDKLFVLEGDEYPSAHDDPRAKFLHLHPTDILLTSVVHDHVNVYPTFAEYQKPFRELLALVPEGGSVVVCADEPGALALAQESGKAVITYGVRNTSAHYRAENIRYADTTRFDMYAGDTKLGEIATTLLGAHNVEDIVGAAAYALTCGVAFEKIAPAITDFKGVRRRLDSIAPLSSVPVLEGFGSSYEKARAAIEAMTLHFPTKPLVVVFEPHTFGWRNRANLAWYDDVFKEASIVYVAPPETQGAGTHEQLSHTEILERIGGSARAYQRPTEVGEHLTGNEVVLILTSGSLEGTIPALVESIGNKFPL